MNTVKTGEKGLKKVTMGEKYMLCHIPYAEEPLKYLVSNNNDGPNSTKYGSLLWHSVKSLRSMQHAPRRGGFGVL